MEAAGGEYTRQLGLYVNSTDPQGSCWLKYAPDRRDHTQVAMFAPPGAQPDGWSLKDTVGITKESAASGSSVDRYRFRLIESTICNRCALIRAAGYLCSHMCPDHPNQGGSCWQFGNANFSAGYVDYVLPCFVPLEQGDV